MPGPGPHSLGRPGPKPKNPGKMFKRIMGYVMKDYAVHYIIVIVCIILSVLCSLQGTLFLKELIDEYINPFILEGGEFNSGPLAHAIARVAVFYAIGVIASFVQQRLMIVVTQGTMQSMRNDLFEKMEKLPIRYFDTHTHGDIMSIYTNDIDTMRQMISMSIPQCFNSAITIVSVLTSMIVLSPWMTLVTIVMVFVMLGCTGFAAKNSGKHFVRQQKQLGTVNGYIEEMITGQKVIKVFCHEEAGMEKFGELNDELFDAASKANTYANALGPINAQLGNLSYVLCAITGGLLAINHIVTVGSVASFLTLNKSFNMPISQVAQQFNSIIMAMAGAERIFSLMDETPEVDEGYVNLVNVKKGQGGNLEETPERTGMWAWKHYHKASDTTEYKPLQGNVVFDGVDFGYTDDKMVLHDIRLEAKPGQKIAFVGSTGAGKTTITNLINRFYDIQDGKIRYDGINVNKIAKADLRRSLGMVLQETCLFTGTIADNIRFGKLDATDEEVVAAAKLANADEFISKLPEGYDTMLTGNGASLSQGQRQLLAIARAAIADPPVLILDEATSSIDTRTERIVQEGMDKLMHGRTSFVIAHRLSTVRNADCIMVLEQGRIVESGTHDQLINLKGRYYTLYTGNSIA
ncbi:MAG: ABC transporter ATP-binding protein/permease [Lachnospiraceae bacterium]|nr:ABC transporter ATP-binding protein/permease [Lachnospiraceae bacterium]